MNYLRTYPALMVFTAKEHPKRGGRYGHHFVVTGYFKDIIKVQWKTDGKAGYVRKGEFMTMERFNAESLVLERKAQEYRTETEVFIAVWYGELNWQDAMDWAVKESARLRKARADAFRLEMQ